MGYQQILHLIWNQAGQTCNMIDLIFGLLIIFIPIFKLSWYGNWFARYPQYWMWVSGLILLLALSQKNIWLKLFIIYCLAVSIWHDFVIGNVFSQNGQKIIVRDFNINRSLFILITICGSAWLIWRVQKLNIKWINISILYSSYIFCYFWIFNDFKNAFGVKENPWIAGAFLAFAIPYCLNMSGNRILNYSASFILLIGVVLTKSTMAIMAAYSGILFYFISEKMVKTIISFSLITLIMAWLFLPFIYAGIFTKQNTFNKKIWLSIIDSLTNASYREDLWFKSFHFTKEENRKPTQLRTIDEIIIGTGLRTYAGYGFLEGSNTLTTHAHNEFLEIFCELGCIGLLIVLGFIFSLYSVNCPSVYKASLTAIIVHSLGYYPLRLAPTGLIAIITIGMILKYQNINGGIEHVQV